MNKPYGLWNSPLSPSAMASSTRLADVQWDSDGQTLVWLEGRGDKNVLVCADVSHDDAPCDLGSELSVRARVGYGGGDFTVHQGAVFFVEAQSGRLYRQSLVGGVARPVTPAFGQAAAPTLAPDGRWLLYVHSYEGNDVLALVDAAGEQWPQQLVSEHDFYMQPCWHPDGQQLAYVAWNHPQMPWDGTTLYLATIDARSDTPTLITAHAIAGDANTAIFQPVFAPDGHWLAYVSDASGWSNIYVYDLQSREHRQITNVPAEHGKPAWVQGMRTIGWSNDSKSLYAIRNESGIAMLYRYAVDGGKADVVQGLKDYTWLEQLAISPVRDSVAMLASSSKQSTRLVVANGGNTRILQRTTTETMPHDVLAQAQPTTWQTGTSAVHGLLYLPPGFTPGEHNTTLPPAIVRIHGGPTSQATTTFNQQIQFFTTRGYTVLDVNYRGSTGYGRDYMLALRNNWIVNDVEDAISGTRHLADQGYADRQRLVIMGGSAGGSTVLEALCQAPDLFRAGLCFYGVSNMFALAADTHKFEERYLDSLLGPLPEASAVYRSRSPLFHADQLATPIAVFQGEDDEVVPKAQSDSIVASLSKRGVPHEYHIYAGEGHGWRKSETVEAFYTAIDAFLRQHVIFG